MPKKKTAKKTAAPKKTAAASARPGSTCGCANGCNKADCDR